MGDAGLTRMTLRNREVVKREIIRGMELSDDQVNYMSKATDFLIEPSTINLLALYDLAAQVHNGEIDKRRR